MFASLLIVRACTVRAIRRLAKATRCGHSQCAFQKRLICSHAEILFEAAPLSAALRP